MKTHDFETGTSAVAFNNRDWCDSFNAAALTALTHRGEFTTDEIVEFIGPPPGHPNAVGAAIVKLARAHGLEITGYRKTTHASRRTARIAVWGRKK